MRMNEKSQSRKKNFCQPPEINITPFLDILLVLLIVFIVASPVNVSSVPIKLPLISDKVNTTVASNYTLLIDKVGNVYFQNKLVTLKDLSKNLSELSTSQPNVSLKILADESVPYKFVMESLSIAKNAGIKSLNMIGKAHKGDMH